jgi:hypothetical protein
MPTEHIADAPPKPARQRRRTAEAMALIEPPMPPETERDKRDSENLTRLIREMAERLRQANLARAVRLAQQALAGRGPLVDHFAELGRRFDSVDEAPAAAAKPRFRVIEGDVACGVQHERGPRG